MNTTSLVSRVDSNALPQWNAASAGYIGMQSGGEQEANRAGARLGTAVRKYWWVVLAAWAVVAIPASIYIWKTIPALYVANGTVVVKPARIDAVTGAGQTTPFYSEFLRSQAELLKNPTVLARAADNQVLKNERYRWFRQQPDLVAYMTDNVEVYPIPGTQNINVSVANKDPQFTMDAVNAVLDAYLVVQSDQIREDNGTKNMSEVTRLRDAAQTALEDAKKKLATIVDSSERDWTDNGQKLVTGVLESLKDTQAKLQNQKMAMEAQIEDLKSRKLPDQATYMASVPTDTDPQIQQWSQEFIRVQLADNVLASKHATMDHPDRVEYRKQLKVLEQKIADRKNQIRQQAWDAYRSTFALKNVEKLNDTTSDLAAVNIQLDALSKRIPEQQEIANSSGKQADQAAALKNQIADNKEALTRYQNRVDELQRTIEDPGFVKLIPVHDPPGTPRVDKRPRMIATANGLGLMLGMGLLVLLVKLRDKIDGAEDLGKLYQPLIVGSVSHAGSAARGLSGRMSRKILGEEMRLLHANLLPPGRTERRVMMVTSPTPSNGKTSIASQLALSLAKSGLEVLLIDADLRKRDLSTMFDVGFRPGLAELLQGKEPELIRPVELLPNLRLMGAGSRLERNPVELFQRKHFHESLALLQDKFDCIIVDTPPTLVVADSRLIARSCDEVLCVVRANVSSQKEVDQTIDALQRITGKQPKIIVNGVAHRQSYYKYKFAYTQGLDLDGAEAGPEGKVEMHDASDPAGTNGNI